MMYLADGTAGMNMQAAALLTAMSQYEISLPEQFYLTTSPYCNCREMGFVLSIHSWQSKPQTNIAFFEHRNSDQLCAIKWEGRTNINGAVTPDDIPEEVYPDKYTLSAEWPYLQLFPAIRYAIDVIGEYVGEAVG